MTNLFWIDILCASLLKKLNIWFDYQIAVIVPSILNKIFPSDIFMLMKMYCKFEMDRSRDLFFYIIINAKTNLMECHYFLVNDKIKRAETFPSWFLYISLDSYKQFTNVYSSLNYNFTVSPCVLFLCHFFMQTQ